MKLSLPPKLVEKLAWVPVISFCKIFIAGYMFDALLCRNRPFSPLTRVTLLVSLIPTKTYKSTKHATKARATKLFLSLKSELCHWHITISVLLRNKKDKSSRCTSMQKHRAQSMAASQVHPLEVLVGSIHYWVVSDVVIIATLDGNYWGYCLFLGPDEAVSLATSLKTPLVSYCPKFYSFNLYNQSKGVDYNISILGCFFF